MRILRVFGVTGLLASSVLAAETPKPNIIIYHCHDYGQFMHCYGVKTVQTPNMDKFAEQGVRFARSFCTAPSCSSSRASLFTGRYPHSNGVLGLAHAPFNWELHPDEQHLAQFLAQAGYETVSIGEFHEYEGPGKWKRLGYAKHIGHYTAGPGTDDLISEMKRLKPAGKPFFICAAFTDAHRNGKRPWTFNAGANPDDSLGVEIPGYLQDTPGTRQELAAMQGAMKDLDENFGRFMRALTELGLEANTLVINTTDHGIAFPRAKCSVYEPGLQIAFMLRYPARKGWAGGIVKNEMISNIDVLPTLLELLGLTAPANIQGRSFAPLLDGRPYKPNPEIFGEMTYHEYYDPVRSVRTEQYKMIANFSHTYGFMNPTQEWQPLSSSVVDPQVSRHPYLELYDLAKDPWELTNLVNNAECAAIGKDLASRLYRQMVETGDPLLKGAVTSPQHEATMKLLQNASRN